MRESIKLQWLLEASHRQNEQPVLNDNFETLKTAIKNGDSIAVKNYLNNPEYQNVVNLTDTEGHTLIQIAAKESDPDSIKYLLDAGARPNIQDSKGRTALHLVVSGGCRCNDCSTKRVQCLENLIAGGAHIDQEDKNSETPLYYAARSIYPECAEALLNLGSNLYHWNENVSVATLLVEYVPTIMKNQLDKCVSFDPKDTFKLRLDFGLLLQVKAVQEGYRKRLEKLRMSTSISHIPLPRETELLQSVLKARFGTELLVSHPVVETFLHFKWLVVRKFFFLLRSIYFFLVALYTLMIFRMYNFECLKTDKDEDLLIPESCQPNLLDKYISGFLYYCAVVIVLTEVYKLIQDTSTYFSSGLDSLWWILSITWGITLIPVFGYNPEYWQYPIAAFGVIYSWVMILGQLGRMPWFAVHIGMLVKVLKDFLNLLFTFSTILVAFALGFSVLIPNHPFFNIKSIPSALFKIFVMMKGDIDYEGLLNRENNPFMVHPLYTIPAHLIFTIFVIVVTILLTSLLVGLAVKDIEEIGKKARVNRSIRLIKEIGIVESAIRSQFLVCGLSKFLCKQLSIENLPVIKRYFLKFSPIHPDDNTLPIEIKEKFIPYMSSCSCQKNKPMYLTS